MTLAQDIENELVEEFEKDFWKELNKTCLTCKKECKQSSKVKVVSCKMFIPK